MAFLANDIFPESIQQCIISSNSTESKKDDKVLEIVQDGAKYLASKPNNTVSTNIANSLATDVMKKMQG